MYTYIHTYIHTYIYMHHMYPHISIGTHMYPNVPRHRKYIKMYSTIPKCIQTYPNISNISGYTQAPQNKSKYKEISPGTEIIPYTDTCAQIHQPMSGHKYTTNHQNPTFEHTPTPDKSIRDPRNLNKS